MFLRVGLIGLGLMGYQIGYNLAMKNVDLVVYNRTREKAEMLSKEVPVKIASSPGDLVSLSDIVLLMLADDNAVEQIVFRSDFMEYCRDNKTIVNLSTVTPEINLKLYRELSKRRCGFIESPVIGGPSQARSGNLILMIAGEEKTYNRVREELEKLGEKHFYLGEIPRASILKLIVNSIFIGVATYIAEIMAIAKSYNLEEHMIDILKNTKYSTIIDLFLSRFKDPNHPKTFTLENAAKDLTYAELTFNRDRKPAHIVAAIANLLVQASRSRFSREDYGKIYRYIVEEVIRIEE
jgi:3-hydroxyisobutyrate dehydrogenase